MLTPAALANPALRYDRARGLSRAAEVKTLLNELSALLYEAHARGFAERGAQDFLRAGEQIDSAWRAVGHAITALSE